MATNRGHPPGPPASARIPSHIPPRKIELSHTGLLPYNRRMDALNTKLDQFVTGAAAVAFRATIAQNYPCSPGLPEFEATPTGGLRVVSRPVPDRNIYDQMIYEGTVEEFHANVRRFRALIGWLADPFTPKVPNSGC